MNVPNYVQTNPTDWLTRLANLEANAVSANPISDTLILGGRVGFKRLATPAAPGVVVTGGAAGTQTYAVAAVIGSGSTPASAVGSSSGAGPTTLDATHYNTLSWAASPGAISYNIFRVSGGATQGLIANISASAPLTLVDNGLVADGSTAPSLDTSAYIGGQHVDTQLVYAADGAISAIGSAIITKGSAAALTLAAPIAGAPSTGGMDGMQLEVMSTTAFAHTVTTPSNKISGTLHIATFANAVANYIRFRAYNGIWYPNGNLNVTLS